MTQAREVRTGWGTRLARLCMAALMFETVSGFAVTLGPFHAAVEWGVLLHTVVGAVTLLPIGWYLAVHWDDYRGYSLSHVVLLGYVALVGLVVCSASGCVVTWQGLLGVRMSPLWRNVHLISGCVVLGTTAIHLLIPLFRVMRRYEARSAWGMLGYSGAAIVVGCLVMAGLAAAYPGTVYINEFPQDYEFLHGEDRPFAPSLARTESGGAFDSRSLAGSETCGTAGLPSPDPGGMEAQRPPLRGDGLRLPAHPEHHGRAERRRVDALLRRLPRSDLAVLGHQEHLRREPDQPRGLQGGHLVPGLPRHSGDRPAGQRQLRRRPAPEYLWQWADRAGAGHARDFLIRTYPDEHNKLSKRMFKAPEYCAACHKQFIDEEVNRVGWVQLQNQYDNWAASHWNQEGDPTRTIECRECHMPLVASDRSGLRRRQPTTTAGPTTASTAATASSPPTT